MRASASVAPRASASVRKPSNRPPAPARNPCVAQRLWPAGRGRHITRDGAAEAGAVVDPRTGEAREVVARGGEPCRKSRRRDRRARPAAPAGAQVRVIARRRAVGVCRVWRGAIVSLIQANSAPGRPAAGPPYALDVPISGSLRAYGRALRCSLQHRLAVPAPCLQQAIEALTDVRVLDHALPTAHDPRTAAGRRQCLKEVDNSLCKPAAP